MDVLFLSQYYFPEPIPKPEDLALALTERGHRAFVITGFPNYPTGDVYEGFEVRALSRETVRGIRVLRTYEYAYHGTSALRRILNYLSFMISAPIGAFFAPKCDVIYVWHPPLTVGVAAWLISKIKRAPFVYDVQDIWPESAVLSGLLSDGFLVRLMARLERFVYKRANHLIVPTEGARQNLIGKGVPPAKVSALPHWIDESLFQVRGEADLRAATRDAHCLHNRFVVLFAGNLGLVQGLETVIEAAARIDDPDVEFVFAGDGADRERLEALAHSTGAARRVRFLGRRPIEEMPALMAAADVLLVHLRPSELSKLVLPSKTMAYLAAGRPILMAMEGAAAELVEESQSGIVTPPGDPERLASAVRHLRSLSDDQRRGFGLRGRAFLREKLSKETIIRQYETILARMAEPTS
jgi:glycosyltransferase involved in cell wall biosynthesis